MSKLLEMQLARKCDHTDLEDKRMQKRQMTQCQTQHLSLSNLKLNFLRYIRLFIVF